MLSYQNKCLATGLGVQRINVRISAAAVSGTEDGKRSGAAGKADTTVRILIRSAVKTTEARIIAI